MVPPQLRLLGRRHDRGHQHPEMAALVVTTPPVGEASVVLERLTGVKLPRATLDREARRQARPSSAQSSRIKPNQTQSNWIKPNEPLPR